MRPHPQQELGWGKRSDHASKKWFFTEQKDKTFPDNGCKTEANNVRLDGGIFGPVMAAGTPSWQPAPSRSPGQPDLGD
jgi:hypothetical protein